MNPPRLRIAIADDDRSTRELLQALLSKLGHEVVVVADDGHSLIQKCAVTEPNLIITDNLMPGVTGVEAAAILYKQRPTPIILLSAHSDPELVIEAERKHVFMYLVKPLSEAHLTAALTRCREEGGAQEHDRFEELDYEKSSYQSKESSLNRPSTTPPNRQSRLR
jgi:two-component system, response regulator PdtaR